MKLTEDLEVEGTLITEMMFSHGSEDFFHNIFSKIFKVIFWKTLL